MALLVFLQRQWYKTDWHKIRSHDNTAVRSSLS